jgi:hypothetical protein
MAAVQAMIDGAVQRASNVPRTEYYLAVIGESDELVGLARLALAGVKAAKLGSAIRADRWVPRATPPTRLGASFNSASSNCNRTASDRTMPPPSPWFASSARDDDGAASISDAALSSSCDR